MILNKPNCLRFNKGIMINLLIKTINKKIFYSKNFILHNI